MVECLLSGLFSYTDWLLSDSYLVNNTLCWCYTDGIEHLSLCCAWARMTGSEIVTVQNNWKILCFCLFVVDNATKSIMSYVQKQWCVTPSIFCPIAVKIHLIQLSPWLDKKKKHHNDSLGVKQTTSGRYYTMASILYWFLYCRKCTVFVLGLFKREVECLVCRYNVSSVGELRGPRHICCNGCILVKSRQSKCCWH